MQLRRSHQKDGGPVTLPSGYNAQVGQNALCTAGFCTVVPYFFV